jgi:hypothetical protein
MARPAFVVTCRTGGFQLQGFSKSEAMKLIEILDTRFWSDSELWYLEMIKVLIKSVRFFMNCTAVASL